ncbi:MAG TPA: hypothetical protein VHH92_03125 [Actinomycetota bacterium]|nr:hypothetical protein [Actinomycetota bacterium]
MAAADENGYRRIRPGIPTGVLVAAVLIALVAVSLLIALLYRETRGPGEILREFARALDEGDCAASYDLLDASVQRDLDETRWCEEVLRRVDPLLDADFDLDQAVLQGDDAEVHVSGTEATVWRLRRYGERSWRVLGPRGGLG